MDRDPVFRRRRMALVAALFALCVASEYRRPVLGTVSIDVDAVRGLAMQAEASPGARALGSALIQVAGMLSR